MNDPVDLSIEGRVAIVSLNSPPLNLFSVAMRDGLIEAFSAVRDIPDIGCMIIRTEGKHFSAGADLSEFGGADTILDARRIRWERDPWGLLIDLPIPTIASLKGIALGSGWEMSLLCDLRIAHPEARLGLPETKLAMLPAAGGTQSLMKAVGVRRSFPLIALSAELTGQEAWDQAIVHRLSDDPDAKARDLAEPLSQLGREFTGKLRRLLRSSVDRPLSEGLKLERRLAFTSSVIASSQ